MEEEDKRVRKRSRHRGNLAQDVAVKQEPEVQMDSQSDSKITPAAVAEIDMDLVQNLEDNPGDQTRALSYSTSQSSEPSDRMKRFWIVNPLPNADFSGAKMLLIGPGEDEEEAKDNIVKICHSRGASSAVYGMSSWKLQPITENGLVELLLLV